MSTTPLRPLGTVGLGSSLNRGSQPNPAATPKSLTSITQAQTTSHIYQVGDRTSLHGSNETAGSRGVGSIAQALKKNTLGGSAIKPTSGTRPIMPLIK